MIDAAPGSILIFMKTGKIICYAETTFFLIDGSFMAWNFVLNVLLSGWGALTSGLLLGVTWNFSSGNFCPLGI